MLRTRTMLLIFFNGLLQRLSLFRDDRFKGLMVLTISCSVKRRLRHPSIVFNELTKERLSFLHSLLNHCQTGLRVLTGSKTRHERGRLHISTLLHRTLLIRIRMRFLVIVLPPKRLQVSRRFLSAPIHRRLNLRLLHPLVRFIMIMTMRPSTMKTNALTSIVARPLILRSMSTPTTTSRFRYLTCRVNFRYVKGATIPNFLLRVGLRANAPKTMSKDVGLPSFLRPTRMNLRAFRRDIRLLRNTTVKGININVRRRLLVANRMATFMRLLCRGPRTTTRHLIRGKFRQLLVNVQARCLVMDDFPFSPSFRFIKRRGGERARARRRRRTCDPTPATRGASRDEMTTKRVGKRASRGPSRPYFRYLHRPQRSGAPFLPHGPPRRSCLLGRQQGGRRYRRRKGDRVSSRCHYGILRIRPCPLIGRRGSGGHARHDRNYHRRQRRNLRVAPIRGIINRSGNAICRRVRQSDSAHRQVGLRLGSRRMMRSGYRHCVCDRTNGCRGGVFRLADGRPCRCGRSRCHRANARMGLIRFFPCMLNHVVTNVRFVSSEGCLPGDFRLIRRNAIRLRLINDFFHDGK